MRRPYKIGLTVSIFWVLVLSIIFVFDDFISYHGISFKRAYSSKILRDDKRLENLKLVHVPDIFKVDFRRPAKHYDEIGDRIIEHRQWIVNLTKSEYMQNVKRKRLLVTTTLNGGFRLQDADRNFICDAEGINLSRYCEIVEDRWYNPMYSNYDNVDAVFVKRDHVYDFYEPKVPPSKKNVLFIMESPYTVHQGHFSVNNPILASYWRGSDIVTPYYKWIPHENSLKTTNYSNDSNNFAEGKFKLAAIVVSHCPTANDRLGYVAELQKYISVDVYGNCGPFECPQSTCFDMIEQQYKFYLAFENANCRDYITEKLFVNALQGNIVPIVYGAHRNDYKFAAPPHSYIHVEDFASPKELADFMLVLDQNDEMYNAYFKWKGSGQIFFGDTDLFCRICASLFYADFHPPKKWPKDSRWSTVNNCLPPGKMYWQREG